ARERERVQPLLWRGHRERIVAGSQDVSRLIASRHIERRLDADDHAIAPQSESVGAHPTTLRGEDFVIGRADQLAASLQHYRPAIARALNHPLGLTGER